MEEDSMRTHRKQEGRVYRDHGAWFVRYYADRVIDGQLSRKRVTKRLGYAAEMTSPHAHREAKLLLNSVNNCNLLPENALTLGAFVQSKYFPHAERQGLRLS